MHLSNCIVIRVLMPDHMLSNAIVTDSLWTAYGEIPNSIVLPCRSLAGGIITNETRFLDEPRVGSLLARPLNQRTGSFPVRKGD
jgi:hypothetical protein